MKNRTVLIVSALLVGMLSVFAAKTAMSADPVTASKHVKVLLENEDVRVSEAIRPPGTVEPMHTHPAYVAYFFDAWEGKLTSADGKVSEKSFPAGSVIYSPGRTHALEVIGTNAQHVLLIEWIKK